MAARSANLTQHRRPAPWRAGGRDPAAAAGLVAAAACAGWLLVRFRDRRVVRQAALIGGVWMLSRATAGLSRRAARLVRTAAERLRRTDAVAEALEESFPASDPPAWTPTAAGPPRQS